MSQAKKNCEGTSIFTDCLLVPAPPACFTTIGPWCFIRIKRVAVSESQRVDRISFTFLMYGMTRAHYDIRAIGAGITTEHMSASIAAQRNFTALTVYRSTEGIRL